MVVPPPPPSCCCSSSSSSLRRRLLFQTTAIKSALFRLALSSSRTLPCRRSLERLQSFSSILISTPSLPRTFSLLALLNTSLNSPNTLHLCALPLPSSSLQTPTLISQSLSPRGIFLKTTTSSSPAPLRRSVFSTEVKRARFLSPSALSTSFSSRVNLSPLSLKLTLSTLSSRNHFCSSSSPKRQCRLRRRLLFSRYSHHYHSFLSKLSSRDLQLPRTATPRLRVLIRTLSSRSPLVSSVPETRSNLRTWCVRSTNRRRNSIARVKLQSFRETSASHFRRRLSRRLFRLRIPSWKSPRLTNTTGRVRAKSSSGRIRGTNARGN